MTAVLEPDLLDFVHALIINIVDNQSLLGTASHQSAYMISSIALSWECMCTDNIK